MAKEETIYAFIDSQNLNLAIKGVGWELDFARFRVYLEDKYNVKKAFLFIGYVPGNEALYTFLVSGDGDFHCLIDYLVQQEKLAHVLIPNPNSYSALLRKFRPYFIYIDKLNKKLEKRRK